MGSLGPLELIIIFFFLFLGIPIALVALFALLRSRRNHVSTQTEIAKTSELDGVMSDHMSSNEAQLSMMEERLRALEEEKEVSVHQQGRADRMSNR